MTIINNHVNFIVNPLICLRRGNQRVENIIMQMLDRKLRLHRFTPAK